MRVHVSDNRCAALDAAAAQARAAADTAVCTKAAVNVTALGIAIALKSPLRDV